MYKNWSEALNIYTAEDCLVWPQWEMCLALERLEAPGSREAWEGEMGGHPGGGGMRGRTAGGWTAGSG